MKAPDVSPCVERALHAIVRLARGERPPIPAIREEATGALWGLYSLYIPIEHLKGGIYEGILPRRLCMRCGEVKDHDEFERNARLPGGRSYRCLTCKRKSDRESKARR